MHNELGSSCAFTGHRPFKLPWGYDESSLDCQSLKACLRNLLERLIAVGVVDYYSGMAEGTDMWLSEALLSMRLYNPNLHLHCILPCVSQAERWQIDMQKRYRTILEQADSVEYVSHSYTKDCMLERNRRLVQAAKTLLAVYNGEWRGGTAATVRYARSIHRKLIILHPITKQLTYIQ